MASLQSLWKVMLRKPQASLGTVNELKRCVLSKPA